jgi:hypothetical protein
VQFQKFVCACIVVSQDTDKVSEKFKSGIFVFFLHYNFFYTEILDIHVLKLYISINPFLSATTEQTYTFFPLYELYMDSFVN